MQNVCAFSQLHFFLKYVMKEHEVLPVLLPLMVIRGTTIIQPGGA